MNILTKRYAPFANSLMSKKSIGVDFSLRIPRNMDTCCVSKNLKYHPDIEAAINDQINKEQTASYAYLSFANYFGHINVARHGCYKFFMKMYAEETKHANEFIKYQLLRGGTVSLNTINPYKVKEKTMSEFFETALKMELEITEKLRNIIEISQKHSDIHCVDYITNKFIKEQIDSMSEIGTLISISRDVANSEAGLYIFDLELEKKY